MIKNEDKIKSVDQFLNIVFDSKEEINKFYDEFELQHEWEYKEDIHEWSCRFVHNKYVYKTIEVGFNDSIDFDNIYEGSIMGTECGEYYDEGRGCDTYEIESSKYKSKNTFYREIKKDFKIIVNEILEASLEETREYNEYIYDRFGCTYEELSDDEKEDLEGEQALSILLEDEGFSDWYYED